MKLKNMSISLSKKYENGLNRFSLYGIRLESLKPQTKIDNEKKIPISVVVAINLKSKLPIVV